MVHRRPVQNQRRVTSDSNPPARIGIVAARTRMEPVRTSASMMKPTAAGMTHNSAIRPRPMPLTPLAAFCRAELWSLMPFQESTLRPVWRMPVASESLAATSRPSTPSPPATTPLYWKRPTTSRPNPRPCMTDRPIWMKAAVTATSPPSHKVIG